MNEKQRAGHQPVRRAATRTNRIENMATSSVKRTEPTTGTDFKTFDDGAGGSKSQAVTLVDSAAAEITTLPVSLAQQEPFLLAVAKGNVAGHSLVLLSGSNSDIDSASAETIWNGSTIFDPVTLAGTLSIASGDANDTAAGTGARTITIYGLDANYDALVETIALDGVTPVVTTGEFIAVNSCEVDTVGTGGSNAGEITATNGAIIMFVMPLGNNRTALGFYTSPAGKTVFLSRYNVSQSNASASELYASLSVREGTTSPIRKVAHFGANAQGGIVDGDFQFSVSLPEKSFLRWDASVSSNNNRVNASTVILLVDD